MFTIKTFRYVALAEALSFLILLVATWPSSTARAPRAAWQVMGPIHGVLFLAYAGDRARRARRGGLHGEADARRPGRRGRLPFGGFVVDRWLARTGQLETA